MHAFREAAIKQFNAPGSNAFLFLLSIRAAGRGVNLQRADTDLIYDPDANPKNEEQAIARSHRIGQRREVRVFHLEAVADAPSLPAPVQSCFLLVQQSVRIQMWAETQGILPYCCVVCQSIHRWACHQPRGLMRSVKLMR